MRPSSRRALVGLAAAAALPAAALVAAPQAQAAPAAPVRRPIVFVHGALGSSSQIETQAKRFASNGYPASWIQGQDYDSLFSTNTMDQVLAKIDARIAAVKAETGADKVELVGHSLGTMISQQYLSKPARAANVAHYVNLDGFPAQKLPGGVPTLAVWGEQNPGSITGATNLRLADQSHVQTTSSKEAFAAEYEFFTGEKPATTDVVAQDGAIQLAGRAVAFPSNKPLAGDAVAVSLYEVDPATGARTSATPVATQKPGADGEFGPFTASGTKTYEFAVTNGTRTHHFYSEPFRRTDLSIRLLDSEPNQGIDASLEKSANHENVLLYRNKEWWGNQGAAKNDTLTVNGTNVVTPKSAPRQKRAIGIFGYDVGKNKRSNLAANTPSYFGWLPFISAVDLYIPAATPPDATVSLESKQRGGNGQVHKLAFPNFASTTDTVTATFDDFEQG